MELGIPTRRTVSVKDNIKTSRSSYELNEHTNAAVTTLDGKAMVTPYSSRMTAARKRKIASAFFQQFGVQTKEQLSDAALQIWFDTHSTRVRGHITIAHYVSEDVTSGERTRDLVIVRGMLATDGPMFQLFDIDGDTAFTGPTFDNACGDYPAPCNCDDPATHSSH